MHITLCDGCARGTGFHAASNLREYGTCKKCQRHGYFLIYRATRPVGQPTYEIVERTTEVRHDETVIETFGLMNEALFAPYGGNPCPEMAEIALPYDENPCADIDIYGTVADQMAQDTVIDTPMDTSYDSFGGSGETSGGGGGDSY